MQRIGPVRGRPGGPLHSRRIAPLPRLRRSVRREPRHRRDRDPRARPPDPVCLAGGASDPFLDSDLGDLSDELGDYAAVGATSGDGRGTDFFVEGLWRNATAEVEIDPEQLDDIDDIDIQSRADIDLEGVGINLGLRWQF